MKIEKVNERQIRCTLTSEDLASRHLKINELAYGTEKAKDLFRDMMQQASFEFGFEAEDIPLMIEAIPINSESIVLIITKVEDPEELDTRFSKFAPSVSDEEEDSDEDTDDDSETNIPLLSNIPEEVQELFNKLKYASMHSKEAAEKKENAEEAAEIGLRLYSFSSLDSIIDVAHILKGYPGFNAIYKDPSGGRYVLMLRQDSVSKEQFAKINHVIAEFGKLERSVPASYFYITEHYQAILTDNALDQLASV